MNKTTKMLAVFLTAGLLLAGCAQKESSKLNCSLFCLFFYHSALDKTVFRY